MSRAERNAHALEHVADRITRIAPRLPTIDDRLRAWSAGLSAGTDTTRGRGTHADPTAAAVGRRDPFAHQRRRIAELVALLDRTAAELHSIAVDVLAPVTTSTPDDRSIPRCANVHGCPADNYADPGRRGRCEACYRHLNRHDRDRTTEK